jgi:hypothetical protein
MNKLGKNFLTAEARVQAECRNKPLRMARRSNRFLTMSDSDYARKGGALMRDGRSSKLRRKIKSPGKPGLFCSSQAQLREPNTFAKYSQIDIAAS